MWLKKLFNFKTVSKKQVKKEEIKNEDSIQFGPEKTPTKNKWLAPTLDGFTFNKNDCRSMFDPIDYVIFEGLSEKQKVDKILFVDIKSGKARLSAKQKKIKIAQCQDKKVHFLD